MPNMRSKNTSTPVLSDDQINNLLMRPSPAGSAPSNSPHDRVNQPGSRRTPDYKTSILASSPATIPSDAEANNSVQHGLTASSRLLTADPESMGSKTVKKNSSSCFDIFCLLRV